MSVEYQSFPENNIFVNSNSNDENLEPEYHGGYPIQNLLEKYKNCENRLNGGNSENTKFTRYENMVIPFGLVLEKRSSHLHINQSESSSDSDEEDEHDNKHEDELISDEMFDKLFYSVGKSQGKTDSKTRKQKKSK